MTKRWHFWLVLAAIVIGLVVTFWPAPVTDQGPAAPAENEETVGSTGT